MIKNKLISPLLVLFLLLNPSLRLLAQDSISPDSSQITVNGEVIEEENEEETSLNASKAFTDLRDKINSARENLSSSVLDASLLEQRLSEVSDEITSLEDQISQIDDQLDAAKQNIKSLSKNIRSNEDEIDELIEDINLLEKEIEEQKEALQSLLLVIFFENEQAGLFDRDDLQTIKLLLGDENVNQMIERAEGVTLLEYALQSLLEELEANRIRLEEDKSNLQAKNTQLKQMREDLKDQEINLALQKASKEQILEQTQGEEKIYKELISKAKEEQIKIRNDINQLVGDYTKYKVRFEADGFGDENLGTTFDSDKLAWPVNPDIGISAYYLDPSYKAALGVEHHAIDIRAAQNSNLYAPADGVVLKVVTGEDLGYHYVIIGHSNGIMTLYGHMYETFVEVGDNVVRGDLIGQTGGMPGTKGAGWLTTGPHLHFEVFLNGVHVDPLLYLDLTKIDSDYLPYEFKQMKIDMEERVRELDVD